MIKQPMKQDLMAIGSKSKYSKKMGEFLIGCSGWNYPETADVFRPITC
jgi:hypothetical protein